MPTYKEAWNNRDLAAFARLFHPESQLQTALNGGAAQKAKAEKEFKRVWDECGRIEHVAVGRYDEKAGSYALEVTYESRGDVVGFVSFKKRDGRWCIHDIDID